MKINLTWNNKMNCHQFNVDPIDTCVGRPCYESGECYAMAGVRNPLTGALGPRWKVCTKSWNQNYGALMHWSGYSFATEMIRRLEPMEFFRWFTAGDAPEGKEGLLEFIMKKTPKTTHLIFTKNYQMHDHVDDLPNVRCFASLWPQESISKTIEAYTAVITTGIYQNIAVVAPAQEKEFREFMRRFKGWFDSKIASTFGPSMHKVCPGSCKTCRFCWMGIPKDTTRITIFRAHGWKKNKIFKEEKA